MENPGHSVFVVFGPFKCDTILFTLIYFYIITKNIPVVFQKNAKLNEHNHKQNCYC